METPLRDGDILRISAIVQQFDETVILRGNVANPGRYRWTPGMRISDLIPDKDSLQTRGYWQRRIALGLPAPEYTPLFSAYRANLPSPSWQNATGTATGQAPERQQLCHRHFLGGNEMRSQPNGLPSRGRPRSPDRRIRFSGDQANSFQSNYQHAMRPARRRIRANPLQIFAISLREIAFRKANFPSRMRFFASPPVLTGAMLSLNGRIPHTLATSLIPFSLGQAVSTTMILRIWLEPGDVVTVFSTADIHVPQAQR